MANIKQITVNGTTYDLRDESKIPVSSKGVPNGVAELDANGILKESQRPDWRPKADTTAGWSTKTTFIPDYGEIIVYTDHGNVDGKNVPGFKVGDGLAFGIDLPFVSDDIAEVLTQHINNATIHITGQERAKWNDKVSVTLTGEILGFEK